MVTNKNAVSLLSMLKPTKLLCFIVLIAWNAMGQDITPPLDIPLKLSGTFGEFRATHFHAGLDIKTQGKEGFDVRAIKAGSLRRINVSISGYGKCLYIQHADGTTSVYAHLQKFAPKIEAYIKKYQYEKEQFTLQRYLKLNEITLEEGEIIGVSGNTGGSEGPHLHFEIRETKSANPLNPLQLDFAIEDSIRPVIQELYLYSIFRDKASEKTALLLDKKNDSTYVADIQNLGGTFGLGVRLFDRQDLSYNRNGIYNIKLAVNGSTRFSYTFDRIDFSDGKNINALIDYATYSEERIRVQKLFRNIDVDYSFLPKNAPNGYLVFEEGHSYQVELIVEDYARNKTYVRFYVEGAPYERPSPPPPKPNELSPYKDYLFNHDPYEVYLPKQTFYAPVKLDIRSANDTLYIEEVKQAQRKGFTLEAKIPDGLDSLELQQLCLAKIDTKAKEEENPLQYVWTTKKDSILKTTSAFTGTYLLARDSLPPSIESLNFIPDQWVSNYTHLKLSIDDDFSGVQNYRATINEQWILMEYEPKDKTLIYDLNDINFKEAKLDFRLEVEDNVGNLNVYETTLFRKPQ